MFFGKLCFTPHKASCWLGAVLFVCAALLVATPVMAAGGDGIAVAFPDIKEPYRRIFEQIIEGVEGKVGKRIDSYPVSADTNVDELKASLQQHNTKVLIALGRQGLATATALDGDFGVMVGGVLTVPESEARQQPVISLTPDPELLFARMKELLPSAKRVFVVFNPDDNKWLIKLAQDAARVHGLQLVIYEAFDLRAAVGFYQKFFAEADEHHDVLWLPQDHTTVEESAVLPLVLQESWRKEISVFSSNAAHVRRGILFSLYPDNEALGGMLANLAQDYLRSGGKYKKTGMMPLRDVKSVVNMRTAKHLRLRSSRLEDFDAAINE